MRRFILPAALILAMGAATPVFASAGLPMMASIEAGPYRVVVSNDSPSAHTGTNVFTLAVFDLPEGAQVDMKLIGPGGQAVAVPLSPLTIVEGPPDAHGGDSHGEAEEAEAEEPAKGGGHGDGHGGSPAAAAPASAGGHGDEHDETPASYNARGKARINETGEWTAVLVLTDEKGAKTQAKFSFDVVQGGPSRIYLAFTGTLMGSAILYGAVMRLQSSRNGGGK